MNKTQQFNGAKARQRRMCPFSSVFPLSATGGCRYRSGRSRSRRQVVFGHRQLIAPDFPAHMWPSKRSACAKWRSWWGAFPVSFLLLAFNPQSEKVHNVIVPRRALSNMSPRCALLWQSPLRVGPVQKGSLHTESNFQVSSMPRQVMTSLISSRLPWACVGRKGSTRGQVVGVCRRTLGKDCPTIEAGSFPPSTLF